MIALAYGWGSGEGVADGVAVGAIVRLDVAAMEALKQVVYNVDERGRPWELYVINTGYAVLGLALTGTRYGLIA